VGKLTNAVQQQQVAGPLMKAHSAWLLKDNESDDSHRDGKIHPSMIGGCTTGAVIGILLLERSPHPDNLLRIFNLGTAIHEMMQGQLFRAGLIATLNNGKPAIEVPMAIPKYDMVGHADGIVHQGLNTEKVAVLEIKSINSMAFAKLTEPKPEHKIQAVCYVMGLKNELNGSKDIIFIYYSKNDSKMKEFKYTVTPQDEQRVLDKITEIQTMIDVFKANPCAPEPKYTTPSGPACRYCSYKRNCHDTFYRSSWDKKLRKDAADAKAKQADPAQEAEAKPLKIKAKPVGLGRRKRKISKGSVGRKVKRKLK